MASIDHTDPPWTGDAMRTLFGRPGSSPVHSRREARQRRIVKAAEAALGVANSGAFLMNRHAGLRGRPLDIAAASDSGLEAVETEICVEARRGLESC